MRKIFTNLLAAAFFWAGIARADQNTVTPIPSAPLTMAQLATFLNNAFLTLGSCFSGASAPAVFSGAVKNYQCWWDTTNATVPVLKYYDGTQWVAVLYLNTSTHAVSFNKVVLTAPASGAVITIADGKTFTVNNTGTISGGDSWTLAIAAAKSLTVSNSLTFTGTDGTSFAYPNTSGTVVTLGATQTLTAKTLTAPVLTAPSMTQNWLTTGIITPTALAGAVNDYNPTGLATANIIRQDGGAADRNITGLVAQSSGTKITVINIGTSNSLVLKNESASSSAANRFAFGADVTLAPSQSAQVWYDTTSSRWRAEATFTVAGGSPTGTVTSVVCAATTITTSGTCYSAGQVVGTATNDNATAGNFGEYSSQDRASGSALGLTTATAANLTASALSLTAGDWDVTCVAKFTGSTTSVSDLIASISTTTATLDDTLGRRVDAPFTTLASAVPAVTVPVRRFSLSGTTSVFCVVRCDFTGGTCTAYGNLSARRVR